MRAKHREVMVIGVYRRIVVGDSAFASVKTAHELRKRGLHFIGIVKTATKRFPKERLKNHPFSGRGARCDEVGLRGGNVLCRLSWSDPAP